MPLFDLHGFADLAKKLNNLVRNGDWDKLAAQMPDNVLDLFAAVGMQGCPESTARPLNPQSRAPIGGDAALKGFAIVCAMRERTA